MFRLPCVFGHAELAKHLIKNFFAWDLWQIMVQLP